MIVYVLSDIPAAPRTPSQSTEPSSFSSSSLASLLVTSWLSRSVAALLKVPNKSIMVPTTAESNPDSSAFPPSPPPGFAALAAFHNVPRPTDKIIPSFAPNIQ